jgi:hypothetical protein
MIRTFRPCVEDLESRDVPAVTVTNLFSHPDPSIYGQPVTFIATVTGGQFPPGADPYVHDTVSFYADGSSVPFATVPVVSGVATYTALLPPLGVHTITAFYSGGIDMVSGWLVNDASTSGVLWQETDLPPVPAPPVPLPVAPLPAHHHHHHHHHHR